MAEQTILCPSCGKRIPISKALTEQAEANLRKDFEAELKKRAQAVEMATEKRFAAESARLEKQIRKETKQESNANLIELRKQLAEVEKREKASRPSRRCR
jgi:uncharacterized Zn finger protein (UPF0148 family)